MKHIKLFETVAAFETARATLDLPNVSLIEATNGVNYLPYVASDQSNVHEYVEIGGIKWATMNIGANSITDTGLYFQWGDTQGYTASQVGSGEGQKYFSWENYKFNNGTESSPNMTKYNSTDGKSVLEASDDAVTAAWGGNWRMPTPAEFAVLGNAVNKTWTVDYQGSGVAGLILTDKTDSSRELFFPAAGCCWDGTVLQGGYAGFYWSSSLTSDSVQRANFLWVHELGENMELNSDERCGGIPVRGVLDNSNS